MVLNKQKGNMYGFVSHTWNAIKGRCIHDCSYCYMKPFWRGEVHLDEKEFKTDLGEGNFIFIGSSTDMWAENIPHTWIYSVLTHCKKYPENTYLFQTKNPKKFCHFKDYLPKNCILGTTMETDRSEVLVNLSKAPPIYQRSDAMTIKGFRKMITIEPIMDFNLDKFISEIKRTHPEFVNIGADSKGYNLPEPSWEKVEKLIEELKKFTKVNIKPNLNRLKKDN